MRATFADVAGRAAAAFVPSRRVRIGAEVEWLVFDRADPTRHIAAADAGRIASGPLPAGGAVTIEPGGQVELVTPPHDGPRQLSDAIDIDARALARRFDEHGLALVPVGLDPIREPRRTLDVARYEAMERHFSDVSPTGVTMMTLTASLQLNIDIGSDPNRAWRRAHTIAPVLAAAFANSPTTDGDVFRPISHRMGIWAATDPTRTRPVGPATDDWLPYILGADVMLDGVSARGPFHTWLNSPDPPTPNELDRHITTLFPPVRPRGFLELRMIDALPAPGRAAAIAAVWALMIDDGVDEAAIDAGREIEDSWDVMRNSGLEHAQMRLAATSVLDAVASWIRPTDRHLADAVRTWREHCASRSMACDVDELLATSEPCA